MRVQGPFGAALLAALVASPGLAAAAVNVVASTEDLASLASEVGGDKVKVDFIGRGYQDPHFVEAKPSFILKLARADLLVVVGRELEIGWLPPLILQSRNGKIQVGASGYLDASLSAKILEIPTVQITRAMGDVHPLGNPHYWLDPDNGRPIAKAIAEGLEKADPSRAAAYRANLEAFVAKLDVKIAEWKRTYAPLRGLRIVTYHNSWPYFTAAFGIEVADWLEPKPGVKPSPSHVSALIAKIKEQKIAFVAREPYFESRTPSLISRQTGVPLVVLSPSVGGVPEVKDYFGLFEYNLSAIAKTAGRSLP